MTSEHGRHPRGSTCANAGEAIIAGALVTGLGYAMIKRGEAPVAVASA